MAKESKIEEEPAPAKAPAEPKGSTPEDFKTEQEKGPPDPVGEAIEPVKAEILKGGRSEPYKHGNPPKEKERKEP